jgi:hypothetical protein
MDLPPDVKKLLDENPGLFAIGLAVMGVVLMKGTSKAPDWMKDLPPLDGRVNGAWRGKGSFGKSGFGGIKVRHK